MNRKISVVLPVVIADISQITLAKYCIDRMREKTTIPFELVIVETGSRHLERLADVYLHFENKTSYTSDWNAGADAATGEYLIHIGMDVLVGDNWIEAMLKCFDYYQNCGVATTAISEPGHIIGPQQPEESINEAFYGALMMVKSDWRLDMEFPDQMGDYDLCLRIYQAGMMAYRNNASHAFHMKLEHSIDQQKKLEKFKIGVERFKARWSNAPWLIARMIAGGKCNYGTEHIW